MSLAASRIGQANFCPPTPIYIVGRGRNAFVLLLLFTLTGSNDSRPGPTKKAIKILLRIFLKQVSLERTQEQIDGYQQHPKAVKAHSNASAIYVMYPRGYSGGSGATSIPEALRMAPGVEVDGVGPKHLVASAYADSRAHSPDHTRAFDGRSVYTPRSPASYWPSPGHTA